MTAQICALPRSYDCQTVALHHDEPVSFDADQLAAFCAAHGADAEDRIADILFRIEERLILAAWQAKKGERRGLIRSAERLRDDAGEIGMVTLVRAAAAVLDCLATDNEAALPGCTARLTRLSDYGRLGNWSLDGGTVA